MKSRGLFVICALILLGIAGTTMSCSIFKSAPDLQDVLNILPSDCRFIFGLDVQKLVKSPIYAGLQKNNFQIGNDLKTFIEETGVDPERDIDFLIGAGRPGANLTERGVAIAVGKFDEEKIMAYIRSRRTPVEKTYEATPIWIFPDRDTETIDKGIVFLNEWEIAFGDLDSLKAVLDVREKGNQDIMDNPTMGPLIDGINTDEMMWFAGDVSGALAKDPVATPLGPDLSYIKTITGTMNIGDTVVGKITADTQDADEAVRLATTITGLIAIGQLAGLKYPGLRTLLGGLTVSQQSTEVSIEMNFPADVFNEQILSIGSKEAASK